MTEDAKPKLLTLKEAAAKLHGAVREGALRKAANEGKLQLYQIGAKHFTTEQDLQRMIEQCRTPPKAHGSTCESGKVAKAPGQSETAEARSAQVAALQIAKALKKPSQPTSRQNTPPRPANVTPLKPALQT